MAVEFFEGFDTFTIAQFPRRYPTISTNSLSIGTGFGGVGQSIVGNAFATYKIYSFPVTARSEYFVGFYYKTDGVLGNICSFADSVSGVIASIATVGGNGFTSNFGGTSSSNMFTFGAWSQIAIHLVISPTVGDLEVRCDGNVAFHLTGLNTGSSNINFIQLNYPATYGNTNVYWDNFWVLNTTGSHSNTWPNGAMIVQTLYPSSDGTYTDWTPNSGGNHYSRVNEAQSDDDTTYVSATGAGNKDTYHYTSLTGVISQVHSVMTSATHRKDNPAAKTMHVLTKSGSTLAESSDVFPTTSYNTASVQYNDDPNTAAQWTTANVNAVEAGVKVVL